MKIRINDLARELGVKSNAILGVLPGLGITRTLNHSSSLDDPEEADKVRKRFAQPRRSGNATLGLAKSIAARFGEEI